MASSPSKPSSSPLLLVGDAGGITVVETTTPLKRLNYFDGKFLRADDFKVEQDYLRQLVGLSNQGQGAGVVYGYDTQLGAGDSLRIGPGLAVDPSGRVLLLQGVVNQGIQALIDASRKTAATAPDATGKAGGFGDCVEVAAPPPTTVVQTTGELYVIAICAAEALCGQQDVYGVACQDACVSATDRPYRLDGIVLRAIPLQLTTPLPTSIGGVNLSDDRVYLRFKVAHSWFADEALRHPDAISRAGLSNGVWCLGAGYRHDCCEVPLAVVARQGPTTLFLDAWTVRRERIDAPARRYWQWMMRMRPSDVFLAQILQFQCQLADALAKAGTVAAPTAKDHVARQALDQAAHFVEQVRSGLAGYRSLGQGAATVAADRPALLSLSMVGISDLHERLAAALQAVATPALPTRRVLISQGLCELPSAGYLPVLNTGGASVNEQIRALLGDGVDLRFCITTADYVAHAVEEAQHMDRIPLLQGIADPKNRPHVDILVPDGVATRAAVTAAPGLYDAVLGFSAQQTGGMAYRGAAREETTAGGGTVHHSAAAGLSQVAIPKWQALARSLVKSAGAAKSSTVTANYDSNAFLKRASNLGSRLDAKVVVAATQARSAVIADVIAAQGAVREATPAVRASSATETVDGLWISAQVDDPLRGLAKDAHTKVQLRITLATRPATPLAIELAFTGTLTVDGASTSAGALQQSGRLNGIVSIGLIQENQALEKTTEYLITERVNWKVAIKSGGDADAGSVAMDLQLDLGASTALRLTKTWAGHGAQIVYRIETVGPKVGGEAGGVQATLLGQYVLGADGRIADPADPYHQYAVSGLDVVQAALIVSDPGLKAQAESLLFPAAAVAPSEWVVQAVRDWVAFTRRRERQCAAEVVPTQPLPPPRRYRVIETTYSSLDAAMAGLKTFQSQIKDPVALSAAIRLRLAALPGEGAPDLVLSFAPGAVQAQTSDLVGLRSDWQQFKPGTDILYAAIGAVGEVDPALQIDRLKYFEAVVRPGFVGGTAEVKGSVDTLIPYPQDAIPDDADGVMMLFTWTPPQATPAPTPSPTFSPTPKPTPSPTPSPTPTSAPAPVVIRNALAIVASNVVLAAGSLEAFNVQMRSVVVFRNDVPDPALATFIAGLPGGLMFSRVRMWTAAAIDPGASVRAKAVHDQLVANGHLASAGSTSIQVLTPTVQASLTSAFGTTPLPAIDDLIALEM